MDKPKEVMTTVYLEEWQHEALRDLSRRTGLSVSYYVRGGVDLILQCNDIQEPTELAGKP